MPVVNPFFQQCPSASLSTFSSLSHSSSSLRVSVKFTVSCCILESPVTVVNGNIDQRVPDRDEIRLGLPSKGRMASDTLDLLKDCQLSVKQVNPRQYVAAIPQLSNLEVWFQRPKDIVRKLVSGDLDLGIVGLDTVSEYGQIPKYGIFENVNSMKELAQMPQWTPEKPLRVATGFTYLGPKFMKENGVKHVSFSTADGALEAAPANVPPAILLRFLREHRSEWADSSIDAYSAAAVKVGPCILPRARAGSFGGQVILPLAHTIEHEELLEVIKLEGVGHYPEDAIMPRDMFLLQLCSGMDENAVGTCAELIFAPIDASFADDAPLLPSGFRIIPLDSGKEASSPNRTLDLASALEIGPAGNKESNDCAGISGSTRSVMTIAFEFVFESHMQENVASMARQYVRSIISSVQRVALALSPSHPNSHGGLRLPLGTPEANTLSQWICHSYRCYLGVELLKSGIEGSESTLKTLWHHSDAIMCCSLKALPVFTFANQAGLDMLETTLVALQDITLEKILDDHGRKTLSSEFPQIMQQGFACLQGGICLSSMGRPVSYERAVAWKVLNEEESVHCMCFMFMNWSFV